MAGKYRIGKVDENDEYAFLRVVELETEKSKISTLTRAVDKKATGRFIRDIYLPSVNESIFEIYIKLDVNTLREIDNDVEKRDRFIRRHILDSIESAGNITKMLVITLIITPENMDPSKESYLNDQDIGYINDMLMWVYNDIYVVPILHFEPKRITDENGNVIDTIEVPSDKRMEFYTNFVKRLLEEKNTISEKVMPTVTIPIFYKRRAIEDLFELYKDEAYEPNFVVVDFGNTRLLSQKMIGVLPRVHKHFTSLDEEKYFIYGFNVKPHRKGMQIANAEDIGTYLSGINAIGPSHKLSKAPVVIINPSLATLPKILDDNDYKYHSLDSKGTQGILEEWSIRYYDKEIDYRDPKKVPRGIINKHNIYKVGVEAAKISEIIKKGETEILKEKLTKKEITDVVNGQVAYRILKNKPSKKSKNLSLDLF